MIELFPHRHIFFSLFGFSVYWYGVMYVLAFVVGHRIALRIQHHRNLGLSDEQWSGLLTWFVVAVIAGGRAGYVLLYAFDEFLGNPLMLFAIRDGGMSSHGGFLAVIAVLPVLAKRYGLSLFAFGDIVVIPVAVGLAFGRFGNFINQELYGTVTAVPWAIAIPGVEGLRHPTQLYAMAKDLFLAASCLLLLRNKTPLPSGAVAAWFLVCYGILRWIVEFYRVPTHDGFAVAGFALTRGQAYCIPVILFGFLVLAVSFHRHGEK